MRLSAPAFLVCEHHFLDGLIYWCEVVNHAIFVKYLYWQPIFALSARIFFALGETVGLNRTLWLQQLVALHCENIWFARSVVILSCRKAQLLNLHGPIQALFGYPQIYLNPHVWGVLEWNNLYLNPSQHIWIEMNTKVSIQALRELHKYFGAT